MSWDLPANSNSSADQTMAPSQGTVIIRQFLQHYIGLKILASSNDWSWSWAVSTEHWWLSGAAVLTPLYLYYQWCWCWLHVGGECWWVRVGDLTVWLCGPHQDPAVPVRSGMLRSAEWAQWAQSDITTTTLSSSAAGQKELQQQDQCKLRTA